MLQHLQTFSQKRNAMKFVRSACCCSTVYKSAFNKVAYSLKSNAHKISGFKLISRILLQVVHQKFARLPY